MLSGSFSQGLQGHIRELALPWFLEAFTFRMISGSDFLRSLALLFPHFLKIVLAMSSIVVHWLCYPKRGSDFRKF